MSIRIVVNERAKKSKKHPPLNKPFRTPGGPKKFGVYVRNPKTGNIKLVRFGDPGLSIKRDDPDRRRSFRARHKCDQKKPKTSPQYWSCRMWQSGRSVQQMLGEATTIAEMAAPTLGSVAEFVAQRGPREFSFTDLRQNIAASPREIFQQINELIAAGKIVKSSRIGDIQRYRVATDEDQAPQWMPANKSHLYKQVENPNAPTRYVPLAAETVDQKRERLTKSIDGLTRDLQIAKQAKDAINAQVAMAQRPSATLMQRGQLTGLLDRQQVASNNVAKITAMLRTVQNEFDRLL